MESVPCPHTSQNYKKTLRQVVFHPNYPAYGTNRILNNFRSFHSWFRKFYLSVDGGWKISSTLSRTISITFSRIVMYTSDRYLKLCHPVFHVTWNFSERRLRNIYCSLRTLWCNKMNPFCQTTNLCKIEIIKSLLFLRQMCDENCRQRPLSLRCCLQNV